MALEIEAGSAVKGLRKRFDLTGRVAIITGGAGMLGIQHAEAIAEMGGIPVLLDLQGERCREAAERIGEKFAVAALGIETDITDKEALAQAADMTLSRFQRVDILVNNAAHNPRVEAGNASGGQWSRLEDFPLEAWEHDLAVGLTGAFLCSQVFGTQMARNCKGVILNIASDLALIAPDQRLYRQPGLTEEQQPAKPVTYSVIKHGLLGLTRYLATYWAGQGVRVNALSPGGVYAGQEEGFVKRLTSLIPMGRMASQEEYKAAVVFLVSDASEYMTGANLVIDGGRTAW